MVEVVGLVEEADGADTRSPVPCALRLHDNNLKFQAEEREEIESRFFFGYHVDENKNALKRCESRYLLSLPEQPRLFSGKFYWRGSFN